MLRHRVVLGLLLLLTIGVLLVDLYLVPQAALPAAVYAVAIVIAAWSLPPRKVAGIALFAATLELWATWLQQPPAWLFAVYMFGIAFFGLLGTALAARSRHEVALRQQAEAAAARLQAIQHVTEAALSNLAPDDLLQELLQRVRHLLSGDTATLLLMSEDRQSLAVRASIGLEEEVAQGVQIPMGRGVAGRIAATREPAIVEDLPQADEVRSPILRQRVRSLIGVPLLLGVRVIGVLEVGTVKRHLFAREDLELMRLAADRSVSAIERARIDGALRESELRYRTLGETIPYGAWATDASGYCTYVSASFLELVGMTMEEVQQFGWLHLLPPEDVEPTREHWLRCVETGEDFEREHRFRTRDGGWRNVLAIGRPIRDERGRISSWVGLNLDITERKRAEAEQERLLEEVQRRAAEMDALFSSMVVGVAMYDATGRMIMMNRAGERMLRYTEEDKALPLARRVAVMRMESPDGKPLRAEETPTGRALRGETVAGVTMLIHLSDGTIFWMWASASPILDESGQVGGAVATFIDVTAQREAEAERERVLAELEATLSSVADGLIIYGPTGEVLQMNAAAREILGYSPDENGRPLLEQGEAVRIETPEGQPLVLEELPAARALRGEVVQGLVLAVRRPEETRWVTASAGPIRGPEGQLLGAVVNFADVTALHRLQERQEELAHTISHDLRTPLTAIQGHGQLLQRFLQQVGVMDARAQRSTEAIVVGAKRMNAMIQDLVDLARLESGQITLDCVPTDLFSFAVDLKARLSTVLDTSRLRIETPVSTTIALADQNRLERILTNLLGNALKYSEGEVTVRVEGADGQVRVSVIDRGQGIAAEDLPHIFERFYRSKGGRKTEGLGLGLYITRMLVEAHGGRIQVKSKAGEGTIFSFALPLVADIGHGGKGVDPATRGPHLSR